MSFPYESLRDFLVDLEKEGELKRIKAEIDYKDELAALNWALGPEGPAVLVDNIRGINVKGIPLLTWVWGKYKRTAMAVGAKTRDEGIEKMRKALESEWIEPIVVDDGPCKEVIIKEDEIDVRKQFPKIYGGVGEPMAYITQSITISKDPETGIRNGGTYRYGFLDVDVKTGEVYTEEEQKIEMSSFIIPPGFNHSSVHLEKMGGKPLEIAICVGVEPTLMAVGCTPLPYGEDELALAGAIRGKPVELVKCETINLEALATAEWVIEAEVLPGYPDVGTWDGPHAEFHGHHGRAPNRLTRTRIKCITHRKNPIWPMVVELTQPPPYEHAVLLNMVQTANLYKSISEWKKFISKIAMPIPPGSSHNGIAVVQIKEKPFPHFAQAVIQTIWGSREGLQLKYIIVVDRDIDPFDWDQVLYALWTRVSPIDDVQIYGNRPCVHYMDPAIGGMGDYGLVGSQMGIDATVKVPERFTEEWRPRRAQPPQEIVDRVYKKIKDELGLP